MLKINYTVASDEIGEKSAKTKEPKKPSKQKLANCKKILVHFHTEKDRKTFIEKMGKSIYVMVCGENEGNRLDKFDLIYAVLC